LVALQGPSVRTDPAATYAADALFEVFNDPGSPFQRRLVDAGPFQSVTGHYLTLDHTGPIELRGKTTPAHAQEGLLKLLDELDNLDLLDSVTDDDLAIAKKRREVTAALTVEQTAMVAPQLASGLRVIQRIDRASAVVAVRLYLLGGTRQVTKRTAGIEALLLKTSEYGTTQFPDAAARRAMARTGCVVFLEPGVDWTVFGFAGLARDLATAWRVFADRGVHPSLAEVAVAQARGKLLTRARTRYSNPHERIRSLATAAL